MDWEKMVRMYFKFPSSVRIKRSLFTILFIAPMLVLSPLLSIQAEGDGGFIPIVATPIYEPGQNAIISWNGTHERLYLTVDIFAENASDGFHIVPFPTEPKVSLGKGEMFDTMLEFLESHVPDYKWEKRTHTNGAGWGDSGGEGGSASAKVMVISEVQLEGHDICVVRVDDSDGFMEELLQIVEGMGISLEGWPEGMDQVIQSYVDRDIRYFTIDNFNITQKVSSIQPVVYEFEVDHIYFPMEISSLIEYGTSISLSMIHPKDTDLDLTCLKDTSLDHYIYSRINSTFLNDLDPFLIDQMGTEAILTYVQFKTNLAGLKGDVRIPVLRTIRRIEQQSDHVYTWSTSMNIPIANSDLVFISDTNSDHRIDCLDAGSKNVLWTYQSDLEHRVSQRFFLSYGNRRDEYHPIFSDLVDTGSEMVRKITRLNATTGEVIYETTQPNWMNNAVTFITIRDHQGKEHMILGSERDFIIMEMETGNVLKDYWNFWSQINGCFDVFDTPNGTKVIFAETYEEKCYCFDPFAEGLPSTWGISAQDPDKEELMTYVTNRTILKAFYYEDTLYGTVYSDPPSSRFEVIDLETGISTQYLDHPLILDPRNIMEVGDHDKDGDDELIFITRSDQTTSLFSYDLDLNMVEWKTNINTAFYGENTPRSIVDWGADGDLDIIITGGNAPRENEIADGLIKFIVVSLKDGNILWDDGTTLNPKIDLYYGKEVTSMVFRDMEGVYHAWDSELGRSEDFLISGNNQYERSYFLDLDADGKGEILQLSGDTIHYVDPYKDDRVLSEWVYSGFQTMMVCRSDAGDSIGISSRNTVMWIAGDIDPDKEEIEPLQLNQLYVYLPHIVPPPSEQEPPIQNEVENDDDEETPPGDDDVIATDDDDDYTSMRDGGEWDQPVSEKERDTDSGPLLLILILIVIFGFITFAILYSIAYGGDDDPLPEDMDN